VTIFEAKVADRLHRQHDVELVCDESLIGAMAGLCLARESGARNVDAFLNQRILPSVSRELLTRLASGTSPTKILLSSSAEGNLTIEFVDPGDRDHDGSRTHS
jgi:type VI secretion system protein VasG